jgi:hypothetical protein
MQDIRLKASVLQSHAAQLRSEAMAYLYSKGEEYTEALSEIIGGIQQEDSEHKRILGTLAEIGFCAVFCEALESSDG